MEKLDIAKTLLYFIKKSWLIIIIALSIITIKYTHHKLTVVEKYKSNVNILVNINNINDTGYSNGKNNSLLLTYSQLLKSENLLTKVIDDLNLNVTPSALSQKINVNYTDNSRILNIAVSDTSSKNAKNIANSIASIFVEEIKNLMNINDIIILDEAVESNRPCNSLAKSELFELFVIGIILGITFVFLIYYFDTTIKDAEEIESSFNIPILGKIYKNTNYNSADIIKTNILHGTGNPKTILLTSSIKKEGKNSTGYSLATSFVRDNEKVLLIDWNSKLNKKDLCNYQKNLNIEEILSNIQKTNTDNLYLLEQTSPYCNENTIKTLIKKLEKEYNRIILIVPPVNDMSLPLILSTLVDNVIIISKIDYTRMEKLQNTIKALQSVNANISGIILNGTKY